MDPKPNKPPERVVEEGSRVHVYAVACGDRAVVDGTAVGTLSFSFSGLRSGNFCLITDASINGLDAAIDQEQADGAVRPSYFLTRNTLPNERVWSATELECASVMYAIRCSRKLPYGIPAAIKTFTTNR